jgi:nucleoside-diphosphate-sugar epimerase
MKHLVLGSSGQIGGHLVKFLRSANEEVIEFDIVRAPLEDLRVHDNDHLENTIDKADFVHFLAFDVGGSAYMKKYQDTYDFIHNNLALMDNTFSILKEKEKPFIFASSQMSNMSHSTYGLCKAVGEAAARSLNGVVVKFWNVYGEEDEASEKTHVITDFIAKARDSRQIKMRTTGEEERQFLYADDCSECLLILSQKYDEINRSENLHITNFQWIKIKEVAEIISKNFEGTKIIAGENVDNVQKGIKNEPDPYILDFWKPKTSIVEGINQICNGK